MNRLAWFAVGVALTGWGVSSTLGGCTSDEPAAEEPTPDPEPEEEEPDPDPGTSGGTSGTTPPPVDAGRPDTGPTTLSTPNKIGCGPTGASLCDAGASKCCWPDLDASAGRCSATPFCTDPVSFELTCDEKADCPGTQRCCVGNGEAICAADCAALRGIQLCRTAAECPGDAGCAERTCNFPDPVTLKFRMCGTTADCK